MSKVNDIYYIEKYNKQSKEWEQLGYAHFNWFTDEWEFIRTGWGGVEYRDFTAEDKHEVQHVIAYDYGEDWNWYTKAHVQA